MQNAESTQHDLQLNYPFFVIHACHPKMNMLHISSRDSWLSSHLHQISTGEKPGYMCIFFRCIITVEYYSEASYYIGRELVPYGLNIWGVYIVYRYFPF